MAGRSGWPWIGGSRDDVQERRAQIYALNRHMKAIEEKRWQCCVAGRQRHVDAISKCMDVFSRCTPPAPPPLHAHRTPAWPIGERPSRIYTRARQLISNTDRPRRHYHPERPQRDRYVCVAHTRTPHMDTNLSPL